MPFNTKNFAKGVLVSGTGFIGGVARGRLSTFEMEREARLDKFNQNQKLLANKFRQTEIGLERERGVLGQARLDQAITKAGEDIKLDIATQKETERHHREIEKRERDKDTEREGFLKRRNELIEIQTTATVPTLEQGKVPALSEAQQEELRAINVQLGISPKAKADVTVNDMQVEAGRLAKSFYTEEEWEDLGINGRVSVVNFVGQEQNGDEYVPIVLPDDDSGGSAGLLGGFTTPMFGNTPATTGTDVNILAPQDQVESEIERYRLK